MKKKSMGFYIKLVIFIILLFISFKYNAFLGNVLISIFIMIQLFLSRSFIYLIIANNNYSKRNKTTAFQWYERAAKAERNRPKAKSIYGYILIKEGHVEESDKVLSSIDKSKLTIKEESQFKLTYALVKWKQGKLDEAISLVEDVHKKYKYSTAYESLGYLLILKGDYDKALEYNLEAYDYDNSNNVIVDNLAESYFYLGDYDKAYDLYEKLIEKNPTFREPYYYYGLILAKKEKAEEALQMLEKALTMKASFLSDLSNVRIQEAIDSIKKPE
jgi:tetratricopeptide (TPR) repeat protein